MKKTALTIALLLGITATTSFLLRAQDTPAAKDEVKKVDVKPLKAGEATPANVKDAKADEAAPAKPKKLEDPLGFLPDVVAKIGDTEITKADVLEEAKPMLQMHKSDTSGRSDDPKLWRQMADKMINKLVETKVLSNMAKAANVTTTDQDLDAEIETLKKELKSNVPPIEFSEWLKMQNLTEQGIKDSMKKNGHVAIKKWYETVIVPSVTKEEIEKYYRDNQDKAKTEGLWNASHILIKTETADEGEDEDPAKAKMSDDEKKATEAKADAAAKKKAEDILAKLKAGGDFAKLAQENSDCPSGKNGGDLGFFQKGKMVKEFEDATVALKPGETSGIVKSNFGYHIIKLNKVVPAGFIPLDMVEKEISAMLAQEKVMKAMEDYKQKQKVEVFFKDDSANQMMPPGIMPQPQPEK